MGGAVLFVDVDQHAGQTFDDNRVLDGAGVPTSHAGGFDKGQSFDTGSFAG